MHLTLDVKNKSIEKPTLNLLTFRVMPEVKFSAEIRKELGKWMQQERESRGIAQKFVAKKIGITETQLSRIENGKSGTERDTVINWARVVGVDENEALRKFKPENSIGNDSHEILEGIQIVFQNGQKLSKKKQQELIDAAIIVARGVAASDD